MHDIFISYSRRDTVMMNRVTASLRDANFTVWTDEGIEPGTPSWKEALATAIKDCVYVVVLFSPDSAESTWVNRELDYAELHHKQIFPLLVHGDIADAVPFGYTTYQFIDMRQDSQFENAIHDLISSLSAHRTEKPHPISSTPDQKNSETLWKWLDFDRVHLTVPHNWKINEPTPENIQKLQILMMGNDETLFYRAIEDFNSNLIYHATGNPFGSFDNVCTMSNTSNMSPLVGFLADYRAPYYGVGFFSPLLMKFLEPRIIKFTRTRYRAEINDIKWMKSDTGRIYSYIWEFGAIIEGTIGMKGKVYTIFPSLSRSTLFLSLICEESRFEEEQLNFDRIAQSLQFTH